MALTPPRGRPHHAPLASGALTEADDHHDNAADDAAALLPITPGRATTAISSTRDPTGGRVRS